MEKNDLYENTSVLSLSSGGDGVCRIDGRAVFLPGALPGELWDIRIVKVSSAAAWARGERLRLASPERVEPACPAAGRCGGCACQHMSYALELQSKLQRVNDALQRIGKVPLRIEEILPAEEDAMRRCKAIFNLGTAPDGRPAAGFYRPRSHEIASVPGCALVRPEANAAAGAVLAWMEASAFPVYDEKAGTNGMRHVFVRSSHATGQCVVTLVSSLPLSPAQTAGLTEALRRRCPEMTGLVLCLNRQKGNVVLAGEMRTLWGDETLTEELCGVRFAVSPRSFFQVNPPQAERLYQKAVEYAALSPESLGLDLYCGAGTISLCLARDAGQVVGAEIVPEAVENARANAAANGLSNAEFLCADAEQAAETLRQRGATPEAVVLDPPRKGLAPGVIRCVTEMAPRRVVYVSCDPATLSRDLAIFAQLGYRAEKGCCVDMFPRTCHVETVALLSRRKDEPRIQVTMHL